MSSSRIVGLPATSVRLASFVCIALLVTTSANAQRRSPSSAESSSPAIIEGPLAERVPSDVNFYIELAGARSEAERAAVAEMYTNFATSLGGMTGGSLPVTLDEFQMLAASNIAVSFRMPTAAPERTPMGWLAIIRTQSLSNASTLEAKLRTLVGSLPTGAKAPRGVTVRGRKVVPLSGSASADSPYCSVAGESILLGDRASIEKALVESSAPAAMTLGTTELYREGRARVGNDAGLFSLMKLPKDLFGKPDPAGAEPSLATLIGVQSLRGIVSGSEPWAPGSPGVTVVALEGEARNLLTIIAGGPAVTMRPAQLLPSDTGIVSSFALDLPALETLLRSSKAAKQAGFDLAEMERQLGVSLRDQLLPALGSEFTVGVRFETPAVSMTMDSSGTAQSSSPPPEVNMVVLVEVKQPEVVRTAFERALTAITPGELSVRDVGGVRLASAGRTAVAVVDGVAMVGEPAEVERVLLARSVQQTLGTSRELEETRGRLDADTIAVVHPTPALKDTLSAYASSLGGLTNASALGLSNLADTVVRREPLGIAVTASGGSAFSVAAIGVIAAIAIPSLLSARGAANESAAIGTLRSLASAQATYQAKHGRYGTMAELIAADMINPDLRNGVERNGYIFREVRPTAKTFEFSATPTGATTGDRSYNIIEDYVIRWSESKVPPRRKAGKPVGSS